MTNQKFIAHPNGLMQQETGTNEGGPKNGDNQEKIVFTIEN